LDWIRISGCSKIAYIGILCKKNTTGFVPCYPSSILPNYDYGYITDDEIWNNYTNTYVFLNKLYDISKGKIPSKPAFKVVEDNVIVGILTITNQFVEINNPLPITETSDDLPVLDDTNYNKVDKDIAFDENYDKDRYEYIKKISLETNLYNAFRNTIRILINKYENIDIREVIEKEIDEKYITYTQKLNKIVKYIKNLAENHIIFLEEFNYNLINDVSICINNNKEKCNKNPLCVMTDDGNCKLLIPKFNLINNNDNETFYYFKITDELIRYNRIRRFIIQPETYFSISPVSYKINDNEIIILQSLLTNEYFDSLVYYKPNKYVNYNNYDNAEPLKTQYYSNEVDIDNILNMSVNKVCEPTVTKINLLFLKKCFNNEGLSDNVFRQK
jgi:hypothetical protein